MKKILFTILKILGFLLYSFVALVIGVGFNSAVAGWGVFLIGVIFVIWRHYKKKNDKPEIENISNKEPNKIDEKKTEKVVNETIKEKQSETVSLVKKTEEKPNKVNRKRKTDNIKFSFSDLFKIKELKAEIQNLSSENNELEANKNKLQKQNSKLQSDNLNLKKEADIKLTLQQMKPVELDQLINKKNKELEDIIEKKQVELAELDRKNKGEIADFNYHIDQKNKEINDKKAQINELDGKIKNLKDSLVDVSDQVMYEDYGLYKPRYDFANSSTFKGRLSEVRSDQKMMIKEGTAGDIFRPMLLDNSESKGHSMQKKNIKQLVRSFNVECEAAINKVTKSNIEMIEKRINRSFDQLNKLNEPNGVRLTSQYLDSKLDEAHIALEYALKKEQERELLREQRQREKEERQAQKEMAQERAKYEKDETHFQQAKDLLQNKIDNSKSEVEVESLKRKLAELQGKLDDIQEKKIKLSNRAENPTAGYVYIISNIGSFGQNVYKIGVTRRLDPMDRINELSSASVPFKFDVHALIFTDDAYKLETELHEYFDRERVNKVNKRKEFFKLDLDEIKKVLDKHKELTFDFQEIPDAPEYRDSLLIEKKQKVMDEKNDY